MKYLVINLLTKEFVVAEKNSAQSYVGYQSILYLTTIFLS